MSNDQVILVNGEYHSRVPAHHVDSVVDGLEMDGFIIEDETWFHEDESSYGVPTCCLTVSCQE